MLLILVTFFKKNWKSFFVLVEKIMSHGFILRFLWEMIVTASGYSSEFTRGFCELPLFASFKIKLFSLMKRLAIVCRRKRLRSLSALAVALRFTRQNLAAACVVMIDVPICSSCFFLLDAFIVR